MAFSESCGVETGQFAILGRWILASCRNGGDFFSIGRTLLPIRHFTAGRVGILGGTCTASQSIKLPDWQDASAD
ncbi:MAG: hypothetical protein ACKN9T_02570 [Candidatus Methylumidiphilus sp.]